MKNLWRESSAISACRTTQQDGHDSLVRVRDGESGADKRPVDEDGGDLAELVLSLDIALLTLGGKRLDAVEKTLDEWGARVDLEHLLLFGEVPHVLVVHLRVRGADELLEVGRVPMRVSDYRARASDEAVRDDD